MSLVDREEVPEEKSSRSTRPTRSPRVAASSAAPHPVAPPPTTSTSRGSAAVDPASAARCASRGGGAAPGFATRCRAASRAAVEGSEADADEAARATATAEEAARATAPERRRRHAAMAAPVRSSHHAHCTTVTMALTCSRLTMTAHSWTRMVEREERSGFSTRKSRVGSPIISMVRCFPSSASRGSLAAGTTTHLFRLAAVPLCHVAGAETAACAPWDPHRGRLVAGLDPRDYKLPPPAAESAEAAGVGREGGGSDGELRGRTTREQGSGGPASMRTYGTEASARGSASPQVPGGGGGLGQYGWEWSRVGAVGEGAGLLG
ncbi:hypothetical protein SETIT_7G030700v2 [Setaria italica]|uniref:Uncharacterized protein n=1 Tax=Setaria italica TaxID=4555 RepID=A0A368RRT1_SETIT|nr:hypothetical protein SETIT_7G030700v2 [Setaria italica]